MPCGVRGGAGSRGPGRHEPVGSEPHDHEVAPGRPHQPGREQRGLPDPQDGLRQLHGAAGDRLRHRRPHRELEGGRRPLHGDDGGLQQGWWVVGDRALGLLRGQPLHDR